MAGWPGHAAELQIFLHMTPSTSMCSSSSFAMALFWLSRRRPLASSPMASGSFSASCASTSARAFLAASRMRLSASAA